MSKLCLSCNDSVDKLTDNLFSSDDDEIPDWFKKIGNYSLLPPPINKDPRFNLYNKNNIQPIYPPNFDTDININNKKLSPKKTNTWVFYWAARPRDYHKSTYRQPEDAYGCFSNCGLTKVDNNGNINLKFLNPYPYQYQGIKYPPHLHFVYLNNNKFWDEKCHTMIITPDVDLELFKYMISSPKYVVINSLGLESNLPTINNTLRISYKNSITKIYDIIKKNVDNILIEKHGKIENIPYVIYCKNKECKASEILIEKLRKLEFINLITFHGGIEKYFNQTF